MSKNSQQPLDLVQRRRAAYKTLSKVLEGQQLLRAMWMIEERDHTADKMTFLGIVGVTAEIFGIDTKIVSSLYSKLNKYLSLPSHKLPPDPLDEMLRERGIIKNDGLQYSGTSSSIFRANDILGSVETDLNNNTQHQIGQALASEAQQVNCSCMVMARDDRDSSIELSQALAKGILSTGINVIDLGKVPISVLNFVTHHFDGRVGVMITGGHHSTEYNGLKMVVAGEMLEGEGIQKIKHRIDNAEIIVAEKAGSLEKNSTFVNEYIGMICEDIQLSKTLKVVIEGNKGTVSKFATELFKALGCEIINLDGEVFENSADLVFSVVQHQADIGFAFDNEGARLRAVDSEGNVIRSDRLMMLFSKDILKSYPCTQIIHDTQDTSNLASFIKQKSGLPVLWKNGSAFMKTQLKQSSAKLAGDMHGHIYFNDRWFGFDDALYAAARLLELLAKDSRMSHELFSELPESSNAMDLSLDLDEGENQQIVQQLISIAEFPSGNITDIDGLRVDFKNGWMLIRADQSSSALVLHFEAESNKDLVIMQNQLKQLLMKIKPDIRMPF